MGLTWEAAEVAALNRQEWRRSVAEYVHVDMGWIKSSQVSTMTDLSVTLNPYSQGSLTCLHAMGKHSWH